MKLQILRGLKQGPYVQFNTTGTPWDDSSLFLDEEVYGLLSDAFDASNSKFNYYGPTCYRKSELAKLRLEMEKFTSKLDEISDFESFQKVIAKLPMSMNFLDGLETENKVILNTEWNSIVDTLKQINANLLELVQQCIRNNQPLWVFGI